MAIQQEQRQLAYPWLAMFTWNFGVGEFEGPRSVYSGWKL